MKRQHRLGAQSGCSLGTFWMQPASLLCLLSGLALAAGLDAVSSCPPLWVPRSSLLQVCFVPAVGVLSLSLIPGWRKAYP